MSQLETDISIDLNELNQRIIHIIQDMKIGHNLEEAKKTFFELILEKREKYDKIKIELDTRIKDIEGIISVDAEELKKRREAFNLEFQTYKSEIAKECNPFFVQQVDIHNDQIKYPDKNRYSDQFEKIVNTPFKEMRLSLNELSKLIQIPKRNVTTNNVIKSTLHTELKKLELIIQTMNDFSVYCDQLISNYQDVVIVTNDDNRICQVKIQNKELLFVTGNDWTGALILHQYSDDKQHLEQLSDIMDVFYETEDNYYGICDGKKMFTLKTNCEISSEQVKTSLGYFILNNDIVKKILLRPLTAKCMLLLEYQTWDVIDAESFATITHNHLSDEYPDHRNPCPACSQLPKYLEYDLIIKTQQPYSNRYMNSYHVFENIRFENIIWNNFINLLTSDNSFNRKRALHNFKCLFAKTDAEELELYKDIDSALRISGNPIVRNMKLIDLFIDEIKFLLIMKQLFNNKQSIGPTLLTKWNEYCDRNEFSKETLPETPLHYLFNTILSNMFNQTDYITLLNKTANAFKVSSLIITNAYESDYKLYNKQLNNLSKELTEIVINNRKGKLGGSKRRRKSKIFKNNKLSKKTKNKYRSKK